MDDRKKKDIKVVIIGAGPAGLTAAYELSRVGVNSVILERDRVVGGLARTVHYKGYHFDIGGHRFFTKVKPVETMWHEVLGDNFLHRDRLSRIYYNGKFFHYPLRVTNVLLRLGLFNSTLMLLSYFRSLLLPIKNERSFEDWVSNRFGKRLYRTFFKSYTEKVWGIPCNELSADWAAQRIKGLSLMTALKKALIGRKVRNNSEMVKTLIDSFHYPKLGPGMMWEIVSKKAQENGCDLKMEANVEKVLWSSGVVEAVVVSVNDKKQMVTGTHFISSMPMRELIQKFKPQPPAHVLKAASELDYRDFLIVALIVNKKDLFPDNWIYIHDPNVKVGRIQNFKNWSPYMVPDPEKSCIGLEYFCFEGDGLWKMPDEKLFELAEYELEFLGLAQAVDVEDGVVVRMPKAYPVYDHQYKQHLRVIRDYLGTIDNLQTVGRNGMHRYNNMDHSMQSGILAAENVLGADHDLWEINEDEEYLEA